MLPDQWWKLPDSTLMGMGSELTEEEREMVMAEMTDRDRARADQFDAHLEAMYEERTELEL